MVRKCVSCDAGGGMVRFENETVVVEHAGLKSKIDGLSGWRCVACDEIEFDARSAKRYAAAGDKLVLQDRDRQRQEIRRIGRKLVSARSLRRVLPAAITMRSRDMNGARWPLCRR